MTVLDPQRTAVVLVDLMPRLLEQELEPHSGADVLATSLALAEGARNAGAPVVAIRVDRPNVAEQPPGSELAEPVAKVADLVVVKRTVGGFYGTGLDTMLRERGIDTLVMTGIRTNMGVESTARAAADHGYEIVFVEDAMSARHKVEHEASLQFNFPRFGEVVASADLQWA